MVGGLSLKTSRYLVSTEASSKDTEVAGSTLPGHTPLPARHQCRHLPLCCLLSALPIENPSHEPSATSI